LSRNFIVVKAFGSNFPHIKKTSAVSVGHIRSMPSPLWDIICSCCTVQLLFICGCSRENK